MNEKWKQFEETDTKLYFVSTAGRVKHVDKETNEETVLKPAVTSAGRRMIIIPNGKQYIVYRLVAQAFIPNPENKPTVNHKRGLKGGDGIDNLEWMTYAEQRAHALETGLATPGNTPAIALDSNGMTIVRYDTMTEAMSSYDGRSVYYNSDTQIIGNVIVMKQAYYETLSDNELFAIASDCFERMMEFAYVVDGQLLDNGRHAAALIDYSYGTLANMTKDKWSKKIKGHDVTRLKNRIGVHQDDTQEAKIYETVTP